MMNINAVATEIKNRLAKEHGYITLTMKADGETTSVEPWLGGKYELYFSKYGVCALAKDINEAAQMLIEYPKKALEIVGAEEAWNAENEPKVRAYFKKYFEGKTMEQIREEQKALDEAYDNGKRGNELPDVGDWGWYSDYHKDVFGYRPHGVVCGVYINPHA